MAKKEQPSLSMHQKVAMEHGYRLGTKVGTAGYFSAGGGFTHVYHNPRSGTELHVHTKNGVPDSWAHVDEQGNVHRVGADHRELYNHFSIFHPEVAEAKQKEREQKKKEKEKKLKEAQAARQKKKEQNRVMKVKVVKEEWEKSFKEYLGEKDV